MSTESSSNIPVVIDVVEDHMEMNMVEEVDSGPFNFVRRTTPRKNQVSVKIELSVPHRQYQAPLLNLVQLSLKR